MKKMVILGTIVVLMLTGCGDAEANASAKATTSTFDDLVIKADELIAEMTTEVNEESTEDLLAGIENYSKEYIEELYYNTVWDYLSLKEQRKFEKVYGVETKECMYALLKTHGEIN